MIVTLLGDCHELEVAAVIESFLAADLHHQPGVLPSVLRGGAGLCAGSGPIGGEVIGDTAKVDPEEWVAWVPMYIGARVMLRETDMGATALEQC